MTTLSVHVPSPHLEVTTSGRPQSFPLTTPVTSLGRGVSNGVPLAGDRISRRHALVVRDGDGFVLHDLGSLNGVWINTEPLRAGAHRPLRDGDLIRLGDQQLVFRDPRPPLNQPKQARKAKRAITPARPSRARRTRAQHRARGKHKVASRSTSRSETQLRRVIVTVCVLLAALLAAALSLVVG